MNIVLRTGLCALALAAVTAPSGAVTAFDAVESQTIYFQGFSDDFDGQDTPVPGLLGELTLSLVSGLGTNTVVFNYSVFNTSGAPMESARITGFGFNVDGDFDFDASEDAGATGIFKGIDSGNIPMGYADVDICFTTGKGNNCSGGGGDPGAQIGALATGGSFSLVFDGPVVSVALNNFYLRFQSLTSSQNGLSGDSGVGREYTPSVPGVPEPATWATVIIGFGLVGSAMRRRRGTVVHVSA